MPKTRTRPSEIAPCPFEGDPFADLTKSLAEPLDCERVDPSTRTNKRTRLWGGRIADEDGHRPVCVSGHRSRRHAGRKARTRK